MERVKTIKKQNFRNELLNLLSESPNNARERAESEFNRIYNGKRYIVLFGAGNLGRKILEGIRIKGMEPIAISDNNNAIWGGEFDGVPIISPQEAAARYGHSAVFIITIWRAGGGHRFQDTASQLKSLGCSTVISFIPLMWKFNDYFLPYYCIDRPENILADHDKIIAVFDLWGDEYSRHEYLAQIRFRLRGDISGLSSPVPGKHYFPPDILKLNVDEVFVDCGAYDGDDLRSIFHLCPNFTGQIHAFEPDPLIYRKLSDYIENLPTNQKNRISIYPIGVGSQPGKLRFSSQKAGGSTIDPEGPELIKVTSLDHYLKNNNIVPTFIKMDIEGAELEAIAGATKIVSENHPVLAISSYHKFNHLWEIAHQIFSITNEYSFFLRPHNEEGWDLVTYAIPQKRKQKHNFQ